MLTREEILVLPAGRALNALVAEKALGFVRRRTMTGYGRRDGRHAVVLIDEESALNYPEIYPTLQGDEFEDELILAFNCPDCSRDMGDAWLIVETLGKTHELRFYTKHVRQESGPMLNCGHQALFRPFGSTAVDAGHLHETATLAICRAALLALLDTAPPTLSGNNPKS